jgi:UDP-2,4-diacetamido-2,4,6-trideoxy-beta-L-altropyranose hydrolase
VTPLLIRADASPRMGTGHVLRCLALAQAWQDEGCHAHFALAGAPPGVAERLASEGATVHRLGADAGSAVDAHEVGRLARELGAAWVVLDGYHFAADYQRALKEAGLRLLAVDDFGSAAGGPADVLLNQNLYADEALYRGRARDALLLLGPRYALLRREFLQRRGRRRDVPAVARKVLVTLGGSDPENVTPRAVTALRGLGLEAEVLVGMANPHRAEVEAAARGSDTIRVRFNANVPDLMAWADFAFAAAGSTCWELAFMGLPGLLIVQAENQAPVAASCHSAGIGRSLGRAREHSAESFAAALKAVASDHEFRAAAAARGPELIDGEGARRVVAVLLAGPVRLRPAAPEDCRLVWEWANEPTVRAASFNPGPIPWGAHREWFAGKLVDDNCLFFIVEGADGGPVGQVRCDLGDGQATLSIGLTPAARGKGYGTWAVRRACEHTYRTGRARSVLALVRVENAASRRAFLRAGFVEEGETVVRGCRAYRLVHRP